MKEFSAQTGGRYTYVDDINNLQELSLAFAGIFNECDNFIVSGCQVTGSTITPGLVYINGKLRTFTGATGVTTWPQYIYEYNKEETVAYASGSDKVGRKVYGCSISASVPTSVDELTGEVPAYIQMAKTGGKMMKDAFFGKYALILNSATGLQEVNGKVIFLGDAAVNGLLSLNGGVNIQSGENVCKFYYNGNTFTIGSRKGTGKIYKFTTGEDNGFAFYVNGVLIANLTDTEIRFNKPLAAVSGIFGNISVDSNNVYNSGVAADNGILYLNYIGYGGDKNYYRTTVIGNGKGVAIVTVNGASGLVGVNGSMNLSSAVKDGLVLKHSTLQKTSASLLKVIGWTDANDEQIAYIGYGSTADNTFHISNAIANVVIKGLQAVNITPSIMEDGVLLSDKYVLQTTLTQELAKKSDSDDVYTKVAADSAFAAKSAGLSQFVTTENTKDVLRKQIGAIAIGALDDYPKITNYLSDMAKDEASKKKIRENIGAAGDGDFQTKLNDTGWIAISGTSLYARQIGNHVCIQGKVVTQHTGGTLFNLPNQIDAPRYDVSSRATLDCNCDWGCVIYGGTKACKVVYCSHHGKTVSLSFSYMV